MTDQTTAITGGCLCGAIRYELSEPLPDGGLCPCRVCQKTTGSAFEALIGCSRTAFRYTKGEPKRYRSSSIMEKCFCPRCGSPLTDRYLVAVSTHLSTEKLWVHIGTLDEPEAVTITHHYGVESQLPWLHFDESQPRARCDEDPGLAAAFAAGEAAESKAK